MGRVMVDECSAFVFNILVVPAGQAGVDEHEDVTLIQSGLRPKRTAHTVSVLYIKIPQEFHGGQLVLKEKREIHEKGMVWSGVVATHNVTPHEGLLVNFRGDALHSVRPWCPFNGECTAE